MVEEKNHEQIIKIFWTGGFDSTCRIAQLSRLNVIVQPYYLIDSKYRRSVPYELRAISEIKAEIEKHPETRFKIKPLIKVDISDLKPNIEISKAHRRIRKKIAIGMQYLWLATFAHEHPGIEISFEKEDGGHIYNFFRDYGTLIRKEEGLLSYVVFDESRSDKDLLAVFGNLHFPLSIREKTKLELIDDYKLLGLEGIMLKTWFCHNPVNGAPCGVCNPCKIVIKDGLSFRMPADSLKRNEIEMKYGAKLWFKLWKKIRWRLKCY
jgi:7-cyano-7-deazaguanine synthase